MASQLIVQNLIVTGGLKVPYLATGQFPPGPVSTGTIAIIGGVLRVFNGSAWV
jgi:hypothetical protein